MKSLEIFLTVLPNLGTQESHTVGIHHNLGPQKFPIFKTAHPWGRASPQVRKHCRAERTPNSQENLLVSPSSTNIPERKHVLNRVFSIPILFFPSSYGQIVPKCNSHFDKVLNMSISVQPRCFHTCLVAAPDMHQHPFSCCAVTAHLPVSSQLPFP